MGAWGAGPFDNDMAADWCGDLNDMDPAERADYIRRALSEVVDDVGYLDALAGEVAVAASALIASQLSGAAQLDSPYAPAFVREGGGIDVTSDLPQLAVQALDRVMRQQSEWLDLRQESSSADEAFAVVGRLRETLMTSV
jgi:hypothetical protein